MDVERTIEVDGRARSYRIVTPAAARSGLPLVLVFHGSNQDGAAFSRFSRTQFERLADDGQAIVAFLDGYGRHWNDARASIRFSTRAAGVDDVAFVRAVVSTLLDELAVDENGIYAVGYSNGGQFVVRLIHEAPELLAGAVLIGATQPAPENLVVGPRPAVPLPVLLMHGTRDAFVPYAGGIASLRGFMPRGRGLSAEESAAYFAARNRIALRPAVTTSGTVTRTEYRDRDRQPVTLLTIAGGGHTVPGGRRSLLSGPATTAISAVDEVAAFFGLGDRRRTGLPD